MTDAKVLARDNRYDGLRAIGLLAIILAHVGPPEIVYQLRNFDVPLMVLVSGSVFAVSSAVNKNYWVYILSRVRRLAVPTWIFLSIYFIYFHLINLIIHEPFPYSLIDVIKSYSLTSGVGYVWIIRVFILVAVIMPLFFKLYNRIKDNKKYLAVLIFVYLIYELIYLYYANNSFIKNTAYINFIFQNYILNILPYGCVAGLGLIVANARTRSKFLISVIFLIFFIFMAFWYDPQQFTATQLFKYPPRFYYLSYALFVAVLLYIFSKTHVFKYIFETNFMRFIGRYSLWIYLWHILFLSVWELLPIQINNSIPEFILVYFFVVALATLMTFAQQKFIRKIIEKYRIQNLLKRTLTESFLM